MLSRPMRRDPVGGGSASKGSSWRGAFLFFAFAGLWVWFYRQSARQQQDILLSQRSRDQFEKMYEELLRDESLWRGELDGLRVSTEKLEGANSKLQTELQAETNNRAMVETQVQGIQKELFTAKDTLAQQMGELRAANDKLSAAEGQLAECRAAAAAEAARRAPPDGAADDADAIIEKEQGERRQDMARRDDNSAKDGEEGQSDEERADGSAGATRIAGVGADGNA